MISEKKADFFAGKSKTEITTDEKGVVINDPLYAKVIALKNARTQVVIIGMDAVAIGCIGDISDRFLPELRLAIEKEFNVEGKNVLVNASHTHPPGRLLCAHGQLLERTLKAVREALLNMVPVNIGSGKGREDRIMINRTLRLKDGTHWTIRHANPCPPDLDVLSLGPTDPDIGIIRIDRRDGRPFAVIYNYAGHPLIGVPNGGITANYPGFASDVIESTLGEDTMALFLQGAGGDIEEELYKEVNHPRDARPLGNMLGLSTLKGLRNIKTGISELKVINETVLLPRRTDIPGRIDGLMKEQCELLESLRFTSLNLKSFLPLYIKYSLNEKFPSDYSYRYMQKEETGSDELRQMDSQNLVNINKYLANVLAMEKLTRIQDKIETLKLHNEFNRKSGSATIEAEIQGIKIGDCVIISAPVEMLVEIGLRIKRESPYKNTIVSAFSNGYMHYGPPAEYYDKGGYEVTECFLAPEWENIYEKKAMEILNSI